MRGTVGRDAPQVQAVKDFSAQHKADLRAIELDVGNQGSVDAAIETIIHSDGHIDTVVHSAGHVDTTRWHPRCRLRTRAPPLRYVQEIRAGRKG
jgi:NADP-dependent 3-hydroxy acid dehydrogenase YdfG